MNNKKNLITLNDIASELGVSKTTVSRAISGKGRLSAETREKILEYINENDYRPNGIARSLAKRKTYNIGLVIPGDYELIDLPFFQKCMMGVSNRALESDYDIIIILVAGEDLSQLERILKNRKVDGVILTRTLIRDFPARLLDRYQIPYVVIGSSSEPGAIEIDHDHLSACQELTEILLLKGIKKLAIIGGNKQYMVTRKRLEGFMEAFRTHGLEYDRSSVFLDAENAVIIETYVEEALKNNVDGIICMDDSICSYVLKKLKKDKIKIPEQIKVASFYSSSLLENNEPTITSLQFDVFELGEKACDILLSHMKKKQVDKRTLLGYEVSIKQSTMI